MEKSKLLILRSARYAWETFRVLVRVCEEQPYEKCNFIKIKNFRTTLQFQQVKRVIDIWA
jgi:hypothetical protein